MIFLVLPAYNEKKNLIKIFNKINKLKNPNNYTVVLIDDYSNDGTEKLKRVSMKFKLNYIKHKKNLGLNYALKSGFSLLKNKLKKNDLIVTLDSDNTHPIEIIPQMIKLMLKDKSDIVIASRFLKKSEVRGLSFIRELLSYSAKFIFSLFFPYKNLREYTCNFRVYKSFLIEKLMKKKNFFDGEDFSISVKILLFFINLDRPIIISEYPLRLNYHLKIGKSKMKIINNIYLNLRLIFKNFFKKL